MMASEKRLIDANALLKKMQNWNTRERLINCVEDASTVDAVEVVRCKDCKHRGDDVHCPMCFEEQIEWDDDGYTEVDYVLHDRTTDDGFCPYGERREGE